MLFLLISTAVFAGQAGITPTSVSRMLDRYGAKQTVDKLSNTASNDIRTGFGDFDKVLDGIASGDARWLALVPRLAPGTDAGTAESLPIVLAEALPKNPVGVLRLIKQDASWRDACSYPMIEPTRKDLDAYFKVVVPAVESVRDPALQAAKRVCLSELLKAQRSP